MDTIGEKLKLVTCEANLLEIFGIILPLITSEFAIIYKNRLNSLIFEILMVCNTYWKHANIAENIFNFVRLMCFENDCRNEFRPFIMGLVNLIISHSDKGNILIIRAGFDAFAELSDCSDTAYWFNSSIFKLCEIISLRPASSEIIKSGITMLNRFAHNTENQIILSCYSTQIGRLLAAYYRQDIYILIELLKLFKILGKTHSIVIKSYTSLLFCIFERNNDTEIPTTGASAELNEHIISIFCILAKRNYIPPSTFIPIIPILLSIATNQQISSRVIQVIIKIFACLVKYDQPCRDFVYRYIPQLLNIMCIAQGHINCAARINLLEYHSVVSQCGSNVIQSVAIHHILHKNKTHWVMHLSSFLSEAVSKDIIEDIVLNGLRIIHFIHLNDEDNWEILIPHLDKLLYIIAPYKENVNVCIFMFLLIGNFISNDRTIWRNIALLTKHINLLKKMAQHPLHTNRDRMQKIIAANTIKKFILKLRT